MASTSTLKMEHCILPMEQSFEKLVSCEIFDCGKTMSLGPILLVDSLSTRLISSLKLACRSSPGDMSCWSISDLSAIVVRNFDGDALFCLARYWLNPKMLRLLLVDYIRKSSTPISYYNNICIMHHNIKIGIIYNHDINYVLCIG